MTDQQGFVHLNCKVEVKVYLGDECLISIIAKATIMRADLEDLLRQTLQQEYKLVGIYQQDGTPVPLPADVAAYVYLKNGMVLKVEKVGNDSHPPLEAPLDLEKVRSQAKLDAEMADLTRLLEANRAKVAELMRLLEASLDLEKVRNQAKLGAEMADLTRLLEANRAKVAELMRLLEAAQEEGAKLVAELASIAALQQHSQ